jgi:hypothetical protein
MPSRYVVVCRSCLYQSSHSSQWEASIDVAAHLRDNPTHSVAVVEEGLGGLRGGDHCGRANLSIGQDRPSVAPPPQPGGDRKSENERSAASLRTRPGPSVLAARLHDPSCEEGEHEPDGARAL